jgi:hypothetical protein
LSIAAAKPRVVLPTPAPASYSFPPAPAATTTATAADKEEHLADYNARRANVAAAERAMWEEELSLHSVNVAEAEQGVFRQRVIDWTFRQDEAGFAQAMAAYSFPFRVRSDLK